MKLRRTQYENEIPTGSLKKKGEEKMKKIEIRDLEMERQLDEKAMANVAGGCCPNPNDLPEGSAYIGGGCTYLALANPFLPNTLFNRYPRIPSWMFGMLTPTNNG
jgi:hypothetical protein